MARGEPPPTPKAIPRPRRPSQRGLAAEIERLKRAPPDATIIVWAFDEHRVALKPIRRRVWAPKGQRPIAPVRPPYDWLDVDGFVAPTTGHTEWWVMPTVNVAGCRDVLLRFAPRGGVGPTKQLVLVWDQAEWHQRVQVDHPDGIQSGFRPAYAPAVQPAEWLWPLFNEPLANRTGAALGTLQTTLCARGNALDKQANQI